MLSVPMSQLFDFHISKSSRHISVFFYVDLACFDTISHICQPKHLFFGFRDSIFPSLLLSFWLLFLSFLFYCFYPDSLFYSVFKNWILLPLSSTPRKPKLFCKQPNSNYFGLCGTYGFYCNYWTWLLQQESSYTQHMNERDCVSR